MISLPPHYGQSSDQSVGLWFVGSVIRSELSAVIVTISLIMTVTVTWQCANSGTTPSLILALLQYRYMGKYIRVSKSGLALELALA